MTPELRTLSRWLPLLRRCPVGMPGKSRLGRWLLRDLLPMLDVRVPTQEGVLLLVPTLLEPIAFYLLIDGVYEPATLSLLLRRLPVGGTFVDVGANIGAFTVHAAHKVGETGSVIAIEPSPRIYPYLEHNISLNRLTHVFLQQCAAVDRDEGSLSFYEAPVDHFGMGSLAPQFAAQPIHVRARSLDSVLAETSRGHVDVLKVDVEGFEVEVFRGAVKLLTGDAPPMIIFEFCDWAEGRMPAGRVGDAQQLLRNYGYDVWRLEDFTAGKPALQKNLTSGSAMLVAEKGTKRGRGTGSWEEGHVHEH